MSNISESRATIGGRVPVSIAIIEANFNAAMQHTKSSLILIVN